MSSLAILDFGGNRLTEVPTDVSKLTKLRIFNLRFNKIDKLPTTLSKLKNLEMIQLNANPISETELRRIENMLRSTDVRFNY